MSKIILDLESEAYSKVIQTKAYQSAKNQRELGFIDYSQFMKKFNDLMFKEKESLVFNHPKTIQK